jgi:hypothetical protein
MPSSLTWLDHDHSARDRSLRILALFKEKESRDELGIGGIRDAIADRLFPGTSTIQTRLRYMLLIPWIYERLEKRQIKGANFPAQARQNELALVKPLLDEREAGVFGAQSGSGLKRLPSSVYWSGLGSWGIRRFVGSQQEYHQAVDGLYRRRARLRPGLDDRRDPEDHHADPASQSWHPKLPAPPEGFPGQLDLKVTPDEAIFLTERITASCTDSLLAWLVLHARPADVVEPWLHPQFSDFPQPMQELLQHARLFADMVEGAARLYNLMLAELAENASRREAHRQALAEWAQGLDTTALAHWSLDAFWHQTEGFGHTITSTTKSFVETWVERARAGAAEIADDEAARSLVRHREIALKGARSRFVNRGALAQWSGNAGVRRLVYRWPTVRTLLDDLFVANGVK